MLFSLLRRLFRFETLLEKRQRLRKRFHLTVEMLEDRRLLSVTPQLLRDINPLVADSNPDWFTESNGITFFTANDGTTGTELWRSDGTCAGTTLVKDILPGTGNATPRYLTNVNGTLFFRADNITNGAELWRSDGTCAGTTLVKDINTGSSDAYPHSLTNVNGTLFFSAFDTTHGTELWQSNGTSAGTTLVKDINTGTSHAYPRYLTNANGTLFFSASEATNGKELWRSDGTSAGTTLVKDIYPGGFASAPASLTNVNGTLFFQANDATHGTELWRSDGTCAGTTLVRDINPGFAAAIAIMSSPYLTNVNGTLFFKVNDGTTGSELWRSDGTCAGTTLVNDIRSGSNDSFPRALTNFNGTLFFSATDGMNGTELWRSAGTCAGTTLVKDINSGSGSSFTTPFFVHPVDPTTFNGTLYFQADDGTNGGELWRTDGTCAGTTLVKDIFPGSSSSAPFYLTNINGKLFFGANDGTTGVEPWVLLSSNQAPGANNDAYSVAEDNTRTVASPGVLGNDTDADGDVLSALLVTPPGHGTVSLQANGAFTYTPSANFNGVDSFTYRANDGTLNSNTATVTIFVNAVDDPPVANNDSYSVAENNNLMVTASGVLANDTDADGDPLTAVLAAAPAHGTVSLSSNGAFNYTPSTNFSGTDSFTYSVNDGVFDSNLATVTLVISPGPTDVTNQIRAVSSGLTRNPFTGVLTGTITITNVGEDTLTGPFQVVLHNLTPGIVLTNATGHRYNGDPYITATSPATLARGAHFLVNVKFSNPSALSINYMTQVFTGAVSPPGGLF